jgi:hypothetical protein
MGVGAVNPALGGGSVDLSDFELWRGFFWEAVQIQA